MHVLVDGRGAARLRWVITFPRRYGLQVRLVKHREVLEKRVAQVLRELSWSCLMYTHVRSWISAKTKVYMQGLKKTGIDSASLQLESLLWTRSRGASTHVYL